MQDIIQPAILEIAKAGVQTDAAAFIAGPDDTVMPDGERKKLALSAARQVRALDPARVAFLVAVAPH